MKNHGGSAFPYSALIPDQETRQLVGTIYADSTGITVRDYFAAKAMHALITHYGDEGNDPKCASLAYGFADAMLKERSK